MANLKIRFHVNVAEAIRRGRSSNGFHYLQLSDNDVAGLTPSQRDALSELVSCATTDNDDARRIPYSMTAPMPTMDGFLEGLDSYIVAKQAKAEKDAAEKIEQQKRRYEQTAAVLDARKTTTRTTHFSIGNGPSIFMEIVAPDWPYYADDAIVKNPKAIAWKQEIDAENERRYRAAIAQQEAKTQEIREAEAAKKIAEQQAEAEMKAWIEAHGSDRLKRCIAENIACTGAYTDERLAVERPGWMWSAEVVGDYDNKVVNPPIAAFAVLDRARETAPDAKLVYWTVEADDEDGTPTHHYAAVSTFFGREIVFPETADA